MIKVIHNNNCPNSKAILEYLDEHNVQFQIIDINLHPLTITELSTLFKKLNKKPSKIITKAVELGKKILGYNEDLTDEKALEIIFSHPEIIECPILIKGKVAMPGLPIENVNFFLNP